MLLNSMGVVLSSLATTIPDVQKVFEGLLASYPVKLYPLPTTSVDKGPRKSILDVEHVGILPKPPWSLLCLEHGNYGVQAGINSVRPLVCSTHWKEDMQSVHMVL